MPSRFQTTGNPGNVACTIENKNVTDAVADCDLSKYVGKEVGFKVQVRSPKLTVAFSQSSYALMTYRVVGPDRWSVLGVVHDRLPLKKAADNVAIGFGVVIMYGQGGTGFMPNAT